MFVSFGLLGNSFPFGGVLLTCTQTLLCLITNVSVGGRGGLPWRQVILCVPNSQEVCPCIYGWVRCKCPGCGEDSLLVHAL